MIKKAVFKIVGMHCTSCAINIDGELEDTEGVVSSNTSYAKQQVEVEFDAGKVSEKNILNAVKRAGYTAAPL